MCKIVFTKQALKDLDKLKKSGISAKALVDAIRENPYQNPPKNKKADNFCVKQAEVISFSKAVLDKKPTADIHCRYCLYISTFSPDNQRFLQISPRSCKVNRMFGDKFANFQNIKHINYAVVRYVAGGNIGCNGLFCDIFAD